MDFPKFTFTHYSYQLEQHLNFKKCVNITILHGVCYSLVPLSLNFLANNQQYQRKISQIPELDLPAITPKVNKSRVNQQPNGRYKRFVNTLAGILFDGVNASVNHKSSQPFKKV